MEVLAIQRFAYSPMGTFGQYAINGETFFTVERPWLNNLPRVSCIPEGEYICIPRYYNRGGYNAVEVCDVPGREYILFHKANTMHDLMGCIAPVTKLGCLKGIWAGLDSGTAFDVFMSKYGVLSDFKLVISGPTSATL